MRFAFRVWFALRVRFTFRMRLIPRRVISVIYVRGAMFGASPMRRRTIRFVDFCSVVRMHVPAVWRIVV